MAGLVLAARRLETLRTRAAGVLIVAGLLRALLLPLPPTLSDDLLRYVWDGRVAGAGHNPYRLAPEAPELAPLRDGLWDRLPHRDVPTVYPPLAVGLFSIAALLPHPLLALKLLLTALDLATCALLLQVARLWRLPGSRVVWYAWNPLVSLEVAGMGHVDSLGVAAAVATVWLLGRSGGRPLAAGAAAAASVLAKLVPLLALPAWARAGRRPLAFLSSALVLLLLGLAPLFLAAGGLPPGIERFALSWEFNGPLFEPLWRVSERLGIGALVENGLDRLKDLTGRHELWNRFYPLNYPQLHAKLLLAAGMGAGLLWAWRRRHPLAASGQVFATVLLFSATVYPWYLLWVLPWAALCRQPAWLALSALLPLSYLPQITALPLMPWLFLIIWIPFFTLLWRWPRWSVG